ncbi:MAG TPA: hypothetical protein VFU22_06795, partial [Roseiflexaceae bacterium]|nr:hypothetical protein [Roseiflexaceae bacterium]
AKYSSIHTFSPDGQLFVVASADKSDELWEAKGSVRRLATFLNLDKIIYDPKAPRVIVEQSTGQVYILDIEWLNIAANYPETLRETELMEQICSKIRSSSQFNEEELQPYLENRTPRGCR